jgi:2-dehydropantoate 2-reductase
MTHRSFDNIAVMGAGAVGCYYGAMLARSGAAVRLIGRQALVDAVARNGLVMESATFPGRVAVAATTDPAGVQDAGLVLFCVKATDTDRAGAVMAPHLARGAVVLDLQNGVDNVERLRVHTPNPVVPAVVYVAAEMAAPGVVRHNGRGDLVVGAPSKDTAGAALVAELAAYLSAAQIPARISGNIEGELWMKLILNCAYNAVSALGHARYGRLLAQPEARQVMSEAVAEIVALARKKGVRIAADDPFAATLALADAMPDAISSTAQDLARGRPTEIDHLNGYVVREADRLGVAVPVNRALRALVKLAEGAR